ncbi:MAG: hypothetical protein AB1473_00670 [Thermodesulfobacteriota bacterium]
MKISLLIAVLLCSLAMWNTPTAWSEQPNPRKFKLEWGKTPIPWGEPIVPGTLILATRCEETQIQLAVVIENPDVNEFAKIKEALGLDIPITCDTTEGLVACIQCIDKDRSLRAIQLLQKRDSKRFELLGFGCRCKKAE